MSRREEWRSVLESEVGRLSALSYGALIDALPALECYTVERGSKIHQVEVQLLEKTGAHVLVCVSVDDGSLPASLVPSSATFVVEKFSKQ
jgi:hypothetical protein